MGVKLLYPEVLKVRKGRAPSGSVAPRPLPWCNIVPVLESAHGRSCDLRVVDILVLEVICGFVGWEIPVSFVI